jgi:two-component system nitrogen regulation sensor histidine kinase NtrY
MMNNQISLRTRIFIAMIFLVVVASILIAAITIYQYNEQADDYHEKRLERKEEAIKAAIRYELDEEENYSFELEFLPEVLEAKINEISDIHNLDINIYNLSGRLLRSSHYFFSGDTVNVNLTESTINKIDLNPLHRTVLPKTSSEGKKYRSSFSYLENTNNEPIGIIGVPYLQDNTFQDEELIEFLQRLSLVYLVILLIGIITAYFLSKYITKPIEYVSNKMRQTALDKTNEKIILKDSGLEISSLVLAYNAMIDQIEESAVKLAQIERKQAWREMAKQVAHEIKNPLTPMRLTIQSFAHRFDPEDPEIKQKLKEYSLSLIQQIDTMSSIATAFSSFAEMPSQKRVQLNVVDEVKLALDIFQEDYINYKYSASTIIAKLDKIHLTRIITNLITNAIQAVKANAEPRILVDVREAADKVVIEVIDNGDGISEEDSKKVFEPRFTTKSSGMGLGLPMIKNIVEAYEGTIIFESNRNNETVFKVTLPKG